MTDMAANFSSLNEAKALTTCLEVAEVKRIFEIIDTSIFTFVSALYKKQNTIQYKPTKASSIFNFNVSLAAKRNTLFNLFLDQVFQVDAPAES